jgi:putative transposase
MIPPARARYADYRFPGIISHTVRRYFRFPLGLRIVEELLDARGIIVSHETVRQWAPANSVSNSPAGSVAACPVSATNGIWMRVRRERTTSNGSAEPHRR